MYKIIGANQAEYGPITADQLRQWIAEGRVNGQTPAQAEGETTWRPLAAFPEFASSLPPAPGAAPTYAPTPPGSPAPFGAAPVEDGGRARALSLIAGPSIALIITSSIYLVFSLINFAWVMVNVGAGNVGAMNRFTHEAYDPERAHVIHLGMVTGASVSIVLGILMIIGAIKMRKLQSYGLCLAACIASMLPCSLCCVFTLGFGIWALVVMSKPEVKQYFS